MTTSKLRLPTAAFLLTMVLGAVFPASAEAQVVQNRNQVTGPAAPVGDGNVVVFDGPGGRKVKDGGAAGSGSVPTSRTVSTTSPLGGGGALSSNLTLTCTTCVTTARTIVAGAGLTGGGDFSSDRTINVIANADGSIVANANDVQVGILASDAQHGVRGGGTQHANAVDGGAAGFMTGAQVTKLAGLPTSAVATSRTISTTTPLTGGGDLSANRTLAITAASDVADGYLAAADYTKIQGAVQTTRTVSTTSPLGGGGALSSNLTLTCATCIRGALGSTDNVLMRADGTGGVTAQGSGITVDDSDRIGIGTAVPTASITLASTATGLRAYNTSDQITNTEYLEYGFASNIGVLRTVKAGSATQRALLLDTNTNNISISGATGGLFTFTGALSNQAYLAVGSATTGWLLRGNITTGTVPAIALANNSSFTASTGTQSMLSIAPTVNQTSTAGWDAIDVNPTLTACGSGGCNLARLRHDGTDYFRVDRNGKVYVDGTTTAAGTTGARTIDQPTGSVNFLATATSLVVTDSLVSTSDYIMCTVQTNDTTAKSCAAVPAAGSFTLYLNAAATAETKVAFWVIQPQ